MITMRFVCTPTMGLVLDQPNGTLPIRISVYSPCSSTMPSNGWPVRNAGMAKHRKTTPADLSPIASRSPWWVSVLIAAGAWFIFHAIATSQPAPISNPHGFSSLVTGQVFRAFAQLGQFLLLPFFLIAASTSVVSHARRRRAWLMPPNLARLWMASVGSGLNGRCLAAKARNSHSVPSLF